ncbi:MAG: hypothetical protein ABW139_08720 [Candidatus Thiodiazotropha sp. DIVDIV]
MGMGISAEFTLFEDKKDFMLETEGSGWVEIVGNELYPGFLQAGLLQALLLKAPTRPGNR